MKLYLYIGIFLIGGFCYCQTSVNTIIDSLSLATNPKEKVVLSQQIALKLKNTDWERAITYLELAESEAKKTKKPSKYLASIYVTAANMYNSKDVLDVTLDYYQKALNIYKEASEIDEIAKIENNLAIVYARLNNKDKALAYFKNVYKYQLKQSDTLRLAQILNNMGTIYLDKHVDSSRYYFKKAFSIAKLLDNNTLYAYVYTNLGRVYEINNDSIQAKTYFNKAVSYTRLNISQLTKAFVFETTSQYFLRQEQHDSAIYYAKKTLSLFEDSTINFTKLDAMKTLYKANIKNGDYKNAASYFDSYTTIRDSLNVEEKAVNVERLKLQQEYRTRAKIQELEAEKRQFKYVLIGLSLTAGILILLILLIKYKNRITKNRLEKELLKTKQQELRHKLDAKNKVLIGKAMTEMHRTDIINNILEDLKRVKRKAVKKETQKAIDYISKQLQRDLNSNIWQEFEVSFEQVHKSFFKKLNNKHPNLTPKDRRLCALLFLDLTSKEISQITGQSFKSVENARTRLRKKLDLTNLKTNLSTYLNALPTN